MNEPTPTAMQPAGFSRRVAVRAIDALVTAVLAFLLTGLAYTVAFFMTAQSLTVDHNPGPFYTAVGLMLVPGLAVIARYEIASTCRRGQTFGKSLAGIRVVRYEDPDAPSGDPRLCDLRQSILRWAIPHGAGLLVGVVSLLVAIPRIKDYGGYVGVGAGAAAWAVVYASSLFDSHGRGWHDKAAGTIVEIGGELSPVESGDPDRSPPPDGHGSTKHPSDSAASKTAPQGDDSSYGLVSDYYAPRGDRPSGSRNTM